MALCSFLDWHERRSRDIADHTRLEVHVDPGQRRRGKLWSLALPVISLLIPDMPRHWFVTAQKNQARLNTILWLHRTSLLTEDQELLVGPAQSRPMPSGGMTSHGSYGSAPYSVVRGWATSRIIVSSWYRRGSDVPKPCIPARLSKASCRACCQASTLVHCA